MSQEKDQDLIVKVTGGNPGEKPSIIDGDTEVTSPGDARGLLAANRNIEFRPGARISTTGGESNKTIELERPSIGTT